MAPKKQTATTIQPSLRQAALSTHQHLESLRLKIRELQAQKESVEKASIPLSEGLARVNQGLDVLRSRLLEKFVRPSSIFNQSSDGTEIKNSLGGLSSFDMRLLLEPESLKKQITDLLSEQFKGIQGITRGEREERLRELTATLLDLETQEELLIWQSELVGITIDRREDINPSVILSVGCDSAVPTPA